jgi:putative hydrolase of the HAD superfamily
MPVLFDLDDTLLDDRGAQAVYIEQLYRAHEDTLPHASAVEFGSAWRAAIERHFARFAAGEISADEQRRARVRDVFGRPDMPEPHVDAFIERFLSLYASAWRLFADVLPVLDALHTYELGVITNGIHAQQLDKLRRTGIIERFRVVVVSEAVGHAKPAPQIFERACAQLGCAARDCIFVGDDWRNDVEGARAAGMTPVWVNRHGAVTPAGAAVAQVQALSELVGRADLRAMIERG